MFERDRDIYYRGSLFSVYHQIALVTELPVLIEDIGKHLTKARRDGLDYRNIMPSPFSSRPNGLKLISPVILSIRLVN